MAKRLSRHTLVFVVLGCMVPSTTVLGQECAEPLLEAAKGTYELGFFDETIETLKPCLPEGFREIRSSGFLREGQRLRAHRFMALSYFEKGDPDSSRAWVRILMKEEYAYQANLDTDPLFFQRWVDELRPKWYQRRWVRFGGVAVVGAMLGFVLIRGGAEPLPGPPLPN